jgi:hypothetical protein
MIRLVLAALRARRAQTWTVLALAVIAVAGAVGAPWYVLASARAATAAEVSAASARERAVSVAHDTRLTAADTPAGALDDLRTAVEHALQIPGAQPVLSLYQLGDATLPRGLLALQVAYREGACPHLTLTGACPRAANEVVISRRTAELTGLGTGGVLPVAPRLVNGSMALRVVGVYDLDVNELYWAGSPLVDVPPDATGNPLGDPVFTGLDTFAAQPGLAAPTVRYDLAVPEAVLRGGSDLAARLDAAAYELRQQGLSLDTQVRGLIERVTRDRGSVRVGVVAGAAQLLALCWFALYLAGRYTARDRRGDVALLKLRGAGRRRILRLIAGQAAAPVLAGVVPGVALGYLAARSLAGPVPDPAMVRQAAVLSAVALGMAVFGALAALIVAELGTLRAPVATLLRRIPPRPHAVRLGRWGSARISGAGAADLALVAVAVAGVYQAHAQGGTAAPGLALLAPGLVALAVALLLARLVGYLAGRVGGWGLRTGRLRVALGALQVARRPGTDRVFALLVIAVAVLGTAADSWSAGAAARADRASVDLGAPRVLTVRARNQEHLLGAVRAADPAGRSAMAVVVSTSGSQGSPPMLAVDSPRLARVSSWRPEYGPVGAITAALRPGAPPELTVTGDALTIEAGADAPDLQVSATVESRATGVATRLTFGPLAPGRATYRAALSGCTSGGGCRLVSVQVSGPTGPGGGLTPPKPGGTVTVYGLGQLGPDGPVATGTVLGDVRRWRPVVASTGMGLTIASRAGSLALTVSTAQLPDRQRVDLRAFVADSPVPLPVIMAGPPPPAWAATDPALSPFGGSTVPVRVVGTALVLPLLGNRGVLLDLESAVRGAGTGGAGATLQVWLTRDAPQSIVDGLRSAGLTVLSDVSAPDREDRLASAGPAATQRFQLLTALLGLLLAAAAVTVAAAVERTPRATELVDLRTQGLPAGIARAVASRGYAVLIGLGVLAGLAGTVVAHWLADVRLPLFVDSWTTLPPPGGPRAGALLLAGLAATVVLGVAAWAAAVALIRRLR